MKCVSKASCMELTEVLTFKYQSLKRGKTMNLKYKYKYFLNKYFSMYFMLFNLLALKMSQQDR